MSEQVKKMLLNLFVGFVLTVVPGSVVMYANDVKHEEKFKFMESQIQEIKISIKEQRIRYEDLVEKFYISKSNK